MKREREKVPVGCQLQLSVKKEREKKGRVLRPDNERGRKILDEDRTVPSKKSKATQERISGTRPDEEETFFFFADAHTMFHGWQECLFMRAGEKRIFFLRCETGLS